MDEQIVDEQKLLEFWLNKINSGNEQNVDDYLSSILSQKETEIKKGYKEVFHPGGSLSCSLSFLVKKGHYELTERLLTDICHELITSDIAIKNFARASRLSDLLHFEELDYHAQSHTKENGDLVYLEREPNIEGFIVFLRQQLTQLDISIQESNEESIFYYTGILLHAVQDLACHRGMTNPEHATYNKQGKSPDNNEKLYDFGYLVTAEFLKQHLLTRLKGVKELLNQCQEIKWKNFNKVQALLSLAYPAFKFKYLFLLEEIGDSNSMTWFDWYNSNNAEDQKAFNQKALEEIKAHIFNRI